MTPPPVPMPVSPPALEALEPLLARYAERVRFAARRYGIDAAVLDEVMQEVRIRLWRLLERGTDPAGIGPTFVYRIAAGAAIDLRRRETARRSTALVEAAGAPARGDSALERSALVDALERCLAALAPARQGPVRLHLSGHPREEIAGLLRWTEAKTRNLLYRGLDDLRRCLGAAGYGPAAAP